MTGQTDPVCGMQVPESGPMASYQGREFRFCSELCREEFLKNPARFAEATPAQAIPDISTRHIAYFSMEVFLDPKIPTYSGGLGVLAGDLLRSAADLGVPMIGVTLLYRKGYFSQRLDAWGNQRELPTEWEPEAVLSRLPTRVQIPIEGRAVTLRAWLYNVAGGSGHSVPVLLLDADCEENTPQDRALSHSLYGGDQRYRLAQEILLGLGGVRMLRALGATALGRFHMNEGHASLLVLELLREQTSSGPLDFKQVREQCVFTTHTPVEAGHDRFPYDLVRDVLGEPIPLDTIRMLGGQDVLNMTLLGLNMSHYVNGVAKKHQEVSRSMFPNHPIYSITNGIHSPTWVCEPFQRLYDRHIPGWRSDPYSLRHVINISVHEIWEAHRNAKERLLQEVAHRCGRALPIDVLTIGFARRATAYKRADLIFQDLPQFLEITQHAGPIQLLFAGKAHPMDEGGKELIRRIFRVANEVKDRLALIYLEDYDVELAKLLVSGVDLWLNTPRRPLEASGTSGMKAAHNAVPSLSVLDGWWAEGHIEGITGWSIGSAGQAVPQTDTSQSEAQELYYKLRTTIAPMFYHDLPRWLDVMRHTVALNASFFNTHRMLQQYVTNAYI